MKKYKMLLLAALLFAACSKDKTEPGSNNNNNNGNTPNKTPQELIIGKWQFVSRYYTDHGDNPFDDCTKDNFWDIQEGGIYAIDEGATKCDPSDEQRLPGTWSMDNYPAIYIKLDGSGSEGTTAKIIQLDNTTLKVLQYEGEPNIENTTTFKRL